jgi:hypothetical protein
MPKICNEGIAMYLEVILMYIKNIRMYFNGR